MFNNWLFMKKSIRFAFFSNFHDVNTPTTANFKLPNDWMCTWKDAYNRHCTTWCRPALAHYWKKHFSLNSFPIFVHLSVVCVPGELCVLFSNYHYLGYMYKQVLHTFFFSKSEGYSLCSNIPLLKSTCNTIVNQNINSLVFFSSFPFL